LSFQSQLYVFWGIKYQTVASLTGSLRNPFYPDKALRTRHKKKAEAIYLHQVQIAINLIYTKHK